MEKIKHLGIWMDHSNAFLMELTDDTIVTNSVISESAHQEIEYSIDKHESIRTTNSVLRQ